MYSMVSYGSNTASLTLLHRKRGTHADQTVKPCHSTIALQNFVVEVPTPPPKIKHLVQIPYATRVGIHVGGLIMGEGQAYLSTTIGEAVQESCEWTIA